MITLVHFNLRDSIMVGKKKTQDVQAHHRAPASCPRIRSLHLGTCNRSRMQANELARKYPCTRMHPRASFVFRDPNAHDVLQH